MREFVEHSIGQERFAHHNHVRFCLHLSLSIIACRMQRILQMNSLIIYFLCSKKQEGREN
uniref:Uncharacterized protein n=1 Tax=Onchocerca volvulus TaxID=6282 RepID=A0A8R1TW45_ONCVO